MSIGEIIVLLVVIAAASESIEMVQATENRVVTMFGEYRRVLEPGINFVIPLVSRTHSVDMRVQMLQLPIQEVITRDNSPITVDAVIYMEVLDAKKAFLEVDDYKAATLNLAQTTLRAVFSNMNLDDTLDTNKRKDINMRILEELPSELGTPSNLDEFDTPSNLDEFEKQTGKWGICVLSVEVREVNLVEDEVIQSQQYRS